MSDFQVVDGHNAGLMQAVLSVAGVDVPDNFRLASIFDIPVDNQYRISVPDPDEVLPARPASESSLQYERARIIDEVIVLNRIRMPAWAGSADALIGYGEATNVVVVYTPPAMRPDELRRYLGEDSAAYAAIVELRQQKDEALALVRKLQAQVGKLETDLGVAQRAKYPRSPRLGSKPPIPGNGN